MKCCQMVSCKENAKLVKFSRVFLKGRVIVSSNVPLQSGKNQRCSVKTKNERVAFALSLLSKELDRQRKRLERQRKKGTPSIGLLSLENNVYSYRKAINEVRRMQRVMDALEEREIARKEEAEKTRFHCGRNRLMLGYGRKGQ